MKRNVKSITYSVKGVIITPEQIKQRLIEFHDSKDFWEYSKTYPFGMVISAFNLMEYIKLITKNKEEYDKKMESIKETGFIHSIEGIPVLCSDRIPLATVKFLFIIKEIWD